MKKINDLEIVNSINRGNSADFAILVDRYKDKGFSLLKRMLRNEMDAEEVLMDSFMKAYKSLSSFRNDAKFSTWFYKIVYNSALSFVASKRRKMENDLSSLEDHYDLQNNDDEIYSKSENLREYLLNLVEQLPPRNALVVVLFYIDDMSLAE
ncbi:MAG: sigma-70 family RNA polymerase sigma factor, partial [Melioribacteraceae bacterium]|nr:sigma-70 family RNA polymerase sigma factor [Melioribacteraceae bacterium]